MNVKPALVETDILLPWNIQASPGTTHSCPVFQLQKRAQLYLNNNKPQKDQKFPVIAETMENLFSLFFVLFQHWLLAISSHSDQSRISGAFFFPFLAYCTASKNAVNLYFSCADPQTWAGESSRERTTWANTEV